MNAYVYQSALYCEECISEIKLDLPVPEGCDPDDERTYDSEDYPKGPYPDGGGEADSPQHCDGCQLFLENPLTRDGAEYVAEQIAEDAERIFRASDKPSAEWFKFYDFSISVR